MHVCGYYFFQLCGHDVRHSLFVLITYALLTMVCQRNKVIVNVLKFIPLFDKSSSVIQCHNPY